MEHLASVVGIDLAAQPARTGVVVLERVRGGGWCAAPVADGSDEELARLASVSDLVGVDAPLGWPAEFVEAVGAHQRFDEWPGGADRSVLTHRETDRVVAANGWGRPLSASADKLGHVAMRCALLQREWAREWGRPAPRDGSGRVVEVYPAAALRSWDIESAGYKGKGDSAGQARRRVLAQIRDATASWLNLDSVAEACCNSHDVLDALVSSLVALSAGCGLTLLPEGEKQRVLARIEGWIHVPVAPLTELAGRA